MTSDDGWEEVYKDDLTISIPQKPTKTNSKYSILLSLIFIFKEFNKPVNIPKINEYIDFNIINKMRQLIMTQNNLQTSHTEE
ncbi:partical DNA repair protein RAD4 [Vairimorpha necatrix]|uniref:Partical DNA repair protein RAD4 n=1 Tax=Vairimorpha necatrix TaxID=6039 RepID=A0AAX4JB07_9MICR